jgi:hypothetical protein
VPRDAPKSVPLAIETFGERVEICVEKMPVESQRERADACPMTDCTAFGVAPAEIIAAAALWRVTWTPAAGRPSARSVGRHNR